MDKTITNMLILTLLYQLADYLAPQPNNLIVFGLGIIGGGIVMLIDMTSDTKEGDK